jgi:hypothetical protein
VRVQLGGCSCGWRSQCGARGGEEARGCADGPDSASERASTGGTSDGLEHSNVGSRVKGMVPAASHTE